ncbi:MAG: hypothetical protein WC260_00235 [Candidatus Pacearchaeota archaeon]
MHKTKRGSSLLSETSIGLIIGVIVVVTLLSLALSFLLRESKSDQILQSLFTQIENSIEEAKKYSTSEITIYQELSNKERYFLVNFQDKNKIEIKEFNDALTTNFFSKKNQLCVCSTENIQDKIVICEKCINIKEKVNIENNFIALDTLTRIKINFEDNNYNLKIVNNGDVTLEKIISSVKDESKIEDFCSKLYSTYDYNEFYQECISGSKTIKLESLLNTPSNCESLIEEYFEEFKLDKNKEKEFYQNQIEECIIYKDQVSIRYNIQNYKLRNEK